MGFYNNIFAYFFKNLNSNDPRDASVCLLGAIQILHLAVILSAFKYFTHINLLNLGSKYYSLLFTIPWLFFLFKFYSKEKSKTLLENFNKKFRPVQFMWAIISVASIFVSMILLFILLSRVNPPTQFSNEEQF
jgi:hypothetical protein